MWFPTRTVRRYQPTFIHTCVAYILLHSYTSYNHTRAFIRAQTACMTGAVRLAPVASRETSYTCSKVTSPLTMLVALDYSARGQTHTCVDLYHSSWVL